MTTLRWSWTRGIAEGLYNAVVELEQRLADAVPTGGTEGQVLAKATGADWDTEWVDAGSGSGIPPTIIDAKGDLIVGSAADTAARLAAGTNGHILTANSGATNGVEWAAPATAGIPSTIIDAKGDLIVGSAADTAARLAAGTNGHILTANSGATNGVEWVAPAASGLTHPQILARTMGA